MKLIKSSYQRDLCFEDRYYVTNLYKMRGYTKWIKK